MTGFGRGTAEHKGARITVDMRAVNHRYLDLKLRGPLSPALEDSITSRIRSTVERGSVSVTVHVIGTGGGSSRIDTAAAHAAHISLVELARNLGMQPPDLALVLSQPGVMVASEEQHADHDPAILEAVEAALAQLGGMRDGEGQALARELLLRIDELGSLRQLIEKLAADIPDRMKKRLHERLRRLLQDDAADKSTDAAGWLDPGRVAQEVAVLADRSDVTEELVRLASHLEQARSLITGKAAAGRRLEFLVQEIGRELNTIGSKSSVTEISTAIVEAKAVLEKVREQVQNVE